MKLCHLQRCGCTQKLSIQSEVSQKHKHRMLTCICGIQKKGIDERICKAEIERGIKCEIETDAYTLGIPGSSAGKQSACTVGDLGLSPGSGRSPGGGHGNSLQCSCLESPMDRGAWRATVYGVAESWTRLKQLSTLAGNMKQMGQLEKRTDTNVSTVSRSCCLWLPPTSPAL